MFGFLKKKDTAALTAQSAAPASAVRKERANVHEKLLTNSDPIPYNGSILREKEAVNNAA